jgi:hypothetical protein
METIAEHYLKEAAKSWLDHKVTHITKTGQRNTVKIKSLSPEERKKWTFIKKRYEKFRPGELDSISDEIVENIKYLTLYVAFKNSQGLSGVDRSDLSLATNNILVAQSLDNEYGVSKVFNIPVDSVVKYRVVDDGHVGEWELPPSEFDEEEKYEYYMYGKDKEFVLDLFEYKDQLHEGEA